MHLRSDKILDVMSIEEEINICIVAVILNTTRV